MATEKRALAISHEVRAIVPTTLETAWTMAGKFAKSGMLPKSYLSNDPEERTAKVFTAMQLGAEVGMSPMQAIQNIAVINGQPSIWGDAQKALVLGSGLCEYIKETVEGEPEDDNFRAICKVKRVGGDEVVEIFTKQDAIRAGLWGKNVWGPYPKRMIKYRARAFALRDVFPDVLKGLTHTKEELEGSPIDVTPKDNSKFKAAFINNETGEITETQEQEEAPKGKLDEFLGANNSNKPVQEQRAEVSDCEPPTVETQLDAPEIEQQVVQSDSTNSTNNAHIEQQEEGFDITEMDHSLLASPPSETATELHKRIRNIMTLAEKATPEERASIFEQCGGEFILDRLGKAGKGMLATKFKNFGGGR